MQTLEHAEARFGLSEFGEEHQQYLTFRLGEEVLAMGILKIKEILEYGGLTTVPLMPDCVRGVINLRGRVVPVVDAGPAPVAAAAGPLDLFSERTAMAAAIVPQPPAEVPPRAAGRATRRPGG